MTCILDPRDASEALVDYSVVFHATLTPVRFFLSRGFPLRHRGRFAANLQ